MVHLTLNQARFVDMRQLEKNCPLLLRDLPNCCTAACCSSGPRATMV